jgi:hypothetical protein
MKKPPFGWLVLKWPALAGFEVANDKISSLDNERGCFASNKYFGVFFGVSDRQIRTYIGTLKAKGFVTVTIKNENERVIRTAGRFRRVPDADIRRLQFQRTEIARKFSHRSPRG